MLTFLRKKKDNLLVKIFIGFASMLMISFYIGTKGPRNNAAGNLQSAPAVVNGEAISHLKANTAIKNQLESYRTQFKGTLPDAFTKMIEQNVIHGLVNNVLINQEAKRLGFATSKDELHDFITSQFQQDGVFNKDYYLDSFLPRYQYEHGTSFENDVREELAAQKIIGSLSSLLNPTDEELARLAKASQTNYKFSIIKIRTKGVSQDVLPKDLKATDTPEQAVDAAQQELANQIYAAWKSGQKIDALLKSNKLEVKDSNDLSPTQLKAVFDGKQNDASFKSLVALTTKAPFPESYFKEGDFYYLVKLNSVSAPTLPLKAEEITQLKQDYQDAITNTIEAAWTKSLTDNAKIVYNNNNE